MSCITFVMITHVLHVYMLQGVVHNELKIARVIPLNLFKADNNMLISNYRPVSVLPVFYLKNIRTTDDH